MNIKFSVRFALWIVISLVSFKFTSGQIISGQISEDDLGESLFGASVIIKGTTIGSNTDFDGKFEFDAKTAPPFTLVISYLGYENKEIEITSENINKPVKVKLSSSSVLVQNVEVVDSRITEKQKESPLTIESMGLAAIRQTPSADFYAGLGTLKGVDLTTASLGFVIVNTRGFNSTRPVRSLQLVDGADNQAPGLNFSLGNFAGSSELDIQKVDLVVGASSAMYGPNAFNGVILMSTKNPFYYQGLSAQVKVGERNLVETVARYARAFANKKGEDKFAFKVNFSFLRADDWEATIYEPTEDSQVGTGNWGGYDAVNIYGDENLGESTNNFANNAYSLRVYPGLGIYHRTGYEEKDLVDYNTKNYKIGGAAHYRFKPDLEMSYTYNFGSGTTVYQGENRYSLKGLKVQQHRFEFGKKDKFFIRAYHTREDGGDSYDAVFTALILQDKAKPSNTWSQDYATYWLQNIKPKVYGLPGFPPLEEWYGDSSERASTYIWADSIMYRYEDSLILWHQHARAYADSEGRILSNKPYFEPGTQQFEDSVKAITSRHTILEGGSGFYDKSSLTHVQGEYKFTPDFLTITVGGSFRLYSPKSKGTIFLDDPDISRLVREVATDENGDTIMENGSPKVVQVTENIGYEKITNKEYGVYLGLEKRLFAEKLILTATGRLDKNENFDFLVSPAASIVYKINDNNVVRGSFSSAIRNPTLQDQYLYYNVGRALLVGNIQGFTDLVTVESLIDYYQELNKDTLDYFDVDPVRPEKVKSLEIGYKGTLVRNLFIDGSYYFSWYKDFLGYKIGAELEFDEASGFLTDQQVYRVSANSPDRVTTQGFSIGLTYGFAKYLALTGNYSWNVLDRKGSDDEIIPAFNTPEHKFNVGISGRDIVLNLGSTTIKNWGFNINYKWIQGFLFEGSPQFTGHIPTYDMLDVQINYRVPKIYTTFKIGATNVLNQKSYQTYGGPYIGRLAYFSILFEMDKI